MNTSKKLARGISAVLCSALLMTGVPGLAETYATVRGGGLNLRQTASLDAKVLGQYPTGTWITVLEPGKQWSRVQVDGKTGYMMSDYLSSVASGTMYVKTNTGIGLNLRTKPSTSGEIITSFKPGTPVTVLKKGSGWYYVSVCGLTGYMRSLYLSGSAGASQPAADPGTGKLFHPNGGKLVNFRAAASLNGAILAAYPVGTAVRILQAGKDWCKVEINGQQGYVSTYFLKR